MDSETHILILMHPKEFKEEKAGTGRLAHLCLKNSEILMGIHFDENPRLQSLLSDPTWMPMLLYPGEEAKNLSKGALGRADLHGRRLLVIILDATWALARKMLRLSPCLQKLPRIMFTPREKSRFLIKQQPQEGCLSTLEAIHELFLSLEEAGLDSYSMPAQLLDLFARMQQHQIDCARDPSRPGYRRRAYTDPVERKAPMGSSGLRRSRFLRAPAEGVEGPPPSSLDT